MNARRPRRAVFTALTGGYERLNERPLEAESDIEFICFTDDPALTSDRWRVVVVPRWFPSDPMRSQRVIKIAGHPELEAYDETLYIDNNTRLKVDPHQILDDWLAHHDLAIPHHSFRTSVRDEFDAVQQARLDTTERIEEQLDHYLRDYPEVLQQQPHWNGMIARRRSAAVQETMDVWLTHVLRYARRDQLSLNVALSITGLPIHSVPLDNRSSPLHDWRIDVGRVPGPSFVWKTVGPGELPYSTLREQLDAARRENLALYEEIHELLSSRSWRLTAPLRRLMDARANLKRNRM